MTPSAYLRIDNPVLGYYVDRAVWLFGSSVQADLDAVDASGKNAKSAPIRKQMVLQQWIPSKDGSTRGRFRDPALGKRG